MITLPREIFTTRSQFFRNTFKRDNNFHEAQNNLVDLTCADPKAIKDYIHILQDGINDIRRSWIYESNRDYQGYHEGLTSAAKAAMIYEMAIMTNLRLRDMLLTLTDIRNARAAANGFNKREDDSEDGFPIAYPSLEFIWFVYDQTPSMREVKDQARMWLVKYFKCVTYLEHVREVLCPNIQDLPEDFGVDMGASLMPSSFLWRRQIRPHRVMFRLLTSCVVIREYQTGAALQWIMYEYWGPFWTERQDLVGHVEEGPNQVVRAGQDCGVGVQIEGEDDGDDGAVFSAVIGVVVVAASGIEAVEVYGITESVRLVLEGVRMLGTDVSEALEASVVLVNSEETELESVDVVSASVEIAEFIVVVGSSVAVGKGDVAVTIDTSDSARQEDIGSSAGPTLIWMEASYTADCMTPYFEKSEGVSYVVANSDVVGHSVVVGRGAVGSVFSAVSKDEMESTIIAVDEVIDDSGNELLKMPVFDSVEEVESPTAEAMDEPELRNETLEDVDTEEVTMEGVVGAVTPVEYATREDESDK
ncbi:hypothetical protein BU23DRAFT_565358 [Bimuria novae-zelandiae CBS 107.79]|uniref:BTB domain-containing protein n=1 Tax=Bimuria novae-zelandiae CBS 107.79 TaxID=1447943 RepID=A0A6A5VHZ9_9PLEO|nr:hypothetical protein BU23DRAFT_565358 [Bimuria novae-zelandiae CBS 107.79]